MASEEDPLLLAKAMLASENSSEEAMRISMMPWLTFVCTTWLFLCCFHHLPQLVVLLLSLWGLICLCALLAMILRPKAHGKHSRVVVLSILSLLLGTFTGFWNYSRAGGVGDYWSAGAHQYYSKVSPSEPADAYRDASVVVFTNSSRPDARLSSAYVAWGQKYCVAPITALEEHTGAAAQYFATGKDCCKDLEFTCGDQAAHAGVVIFNKTTVFQALGWAQDLDYYAKAARMASAKFGVKLTEEPIFLTWVGDADAAVSGLWPQARNVWLLMSLLALPTLFVITFSIEALMKPGRKEKEVARGV